MSPTLAVNSTQSIRGFIRSPVPFGCKHGNANRQSHGGDVLALYTCRRRERRERGRHLSAGGKAIKTAIWITVSAAAVVAGVAWLRMTYGGDTREWAVTVVASYPHDPMAYTQGLTIYEGEMYEGTGRYGRSSVRRVDLSTGIVERRRALRPEYFGEGITILDDRLYQLTWKSGLGFIYELDTFALLRTFRIDGEGWGLTHDGEYLIVSNGSPELVFLDPETFDVVNRVTVLDAGQPVDQLNELEFVRGEVWANVWFDERIARISPSSGEVLGWIDLIGLYPRSQRGYEDVLNGIAFDPASERLFVTGKNWPRLYEVELAPQTD